MTIQGLDYNTQRSQLIMLEYGREIQLMVEHAITLPTKEERQRCANTIIEAMKCLKPKQTKTPDYMQTLWNHLAILSGGRLDIDFPVKLTIAGHEDERPDNVPYPTGQIPVRHYGRALFTMFEKLKTMEPGVERDRLVAITANQMRCCLMVYGQGSYDAERIANDLNRYTDGAVTIDPKRFRFESVDINAIKAQQNPGKKKKKKAKNNKS